MIRPTFGSMLASGLRRLFGVHENPFGKEPTGMESSTVLAFRIFVMLACLIIVPMAAIFGSAFPDVVKSVLVDRVVAWSTGKPVESANENAEPDGFREVSPGTGAMVARDSGGGSQAPRWGTQNRDVASWQGSPPDQMSPDRGVVPLGEAAASGQNQSASFSVPAESGYNHQPGTQTQSVPASAYPSPAANNQPDASRSLGQPPGPSPYAAAPGTAGGAVDHPKRFTEMEQKLREYGATYYLLETWGNDSQLYRFHCRMAVAGNSGFTRHFEATDRDALTAMSEVLRRVEAWRSSPAR
jgi:hypothetical protein